MAKTKKRPITDEIATVENDIFRDYLGNLAVNPDKVLKTESGGKGIELYEDLLRDFEVRSALQTRKLAVVGREWEVIPASDDAHDQKTADFVKDVLMGCNYDEGRQSLLSGIVLGYKPAEIMWEYSEGDVWVRKITGKAARRFVFDLKGNLRLLTLQNLIEGEPVPERKFIVFRNVSDSGSYYGDGLGSSLYWPVWFRKNSVKFWLIFQDKYGSPTPVGKYPAGTPADKQQELLNALEAIQQESAITMPDTMVVELLEAQRSGAMSSYETFCAYMDRKIGKLILGHEASTQSTPGKLGNEQQSVDIRQDYLKADADVLCECQNNSLIRWIVDYNFPDVKAYPKVWIRTDPEEDLKPLAERDRILVREIGVPVSKKYFYDTYGIPQPEEGEELVEIPTTQPPLSPFIKGDLQGGNYKGDLQEQQFRESKCPHCFADNTPLTPLNRGEYKGRFSPDQQSIENLIEKTIPDATKTLQGNEEKILKAVESASSYEEAMSKVLELYPGMNMDALAELVERSTLAAQIFGGYTVKERMRARP